MQKVRDFVFSLAIGGRNRLQIEEELVRTFGTVAMSKSQINKIIVGVKNGATGEDGRKKNAKKLREFQTLSTL